MPLSIIRDDITKVKVDAGKRSGKIIIQYSTNDDLARILDLIK